MLHGRRRNEDRTAQHVDKKARVHELVGKEAKIRVLESGLEANGSGRRVYLVVQRQQCAAGDLRLKIAAVSIDRQAGAAGQSPFGPAEYCLPEG